MRTREVVARVAVELEISQRQAGKAVRALLMAVREALAAGEEVVLPGFGIFSVRLHAATRRRHPSTHEVVEKPACRRVCFVAGQKLKRAASASCSPSGKGES